mmetsp:Transcript_28502/g.58779  ORF Transcript_28502/g.58779 Transcript_28502/m.58779 type:complete len:208 (-) Transcript_28502:355-978(-)
MISEVRIAQVDSTVKSQTASASPPGCTTRLCTRAECKNRLCGMITQPTIPTTCCMAEGGSHGTSRPSATAMLSGQILAYKRPMDKAKIRISTPKNSSSGRVPRRSKKRKMKAAKAVINTPTVRGIPKSSSRPMEQPITSWMSEPTIASSVSIQRSCRSGNSKASRQCSAKWRFVAQPSRAASSCIPRPMNVAPVRAHNKEYPNCAPT